MFNYLRISLHFCLFVRNVSLGVQWNKIKVWAMEESLVLSQKATWLPIYFGLPYPDDMAEPTERTCPVPSQNTLTRNMRTPPL